MNFKNILNNLTQKKSDLMTSSNNLEALKNEIKLLENTLEKQLFNLTEMQKGMLYTIEYTIYLEDQKIVKTGYKYEFLGFEVKEDIYFLFTTAVKKQNFTTTNVEKIKLSDIKNIEL